LLGEALRLRTLAGFIDDQAAMDATLIPFPRPSRAVDSMAKEGDRQP
jgi:hypothetical protein